MSVPWALGARGVLLVTLLASRPGSAAKMRTRDVGRYRNIWSCPESMDSATVLRNYTLTQDRQTGYEYADIDVELTRPAQRWTSLTITTHLCKDMVSHNTCEYFRQWSFPMDVCSVVDMKGMMWTPFIQNFTPKFTCPVKAGIYRGRNTTLDVSMVKYLLGIPLDGKIFKILTRLPDETRRMHVCFDLEYEFKRFRIRS